MTRRPLAACLALAAVATPAVAADPAGFAAVRPFLAAHCVDCHDADNRKGGLRLDDLPADLSKRESAAAWTAVLDRVEAGEMPPKKKPRPPAAETKAMTAALRSALHAADAAHQKAVGRTVYRRLNRAEYENTVHDLFGIETPLQELLPEDAAAHGFDNVAEALSVSSVLVERYLEAADAALDAAIVKGPKPESKTVRVSMQPVTTNPNDYRLKSGIRQLGDGTIVFFSPRNNPINLDRFKAPAGGRYAVRVSASAYQSPGGPVTMAVHAGGFDPKSPRVRLVGHFDLEPGKPRVVEFEELLPVRGTVRTSAFRTPDSGAGQDWATYAGPGVAVHWVEIEGPLNGTWPPPGHRRLLGDVDLKAGTAADAERVLRAFVPRAFRRPVADADVKPFVDLVAARLAAGDPFEAAVRVGLKAVLCAPEFLFLTEKPGKLDGPALAARLSYFLWSSTPDDALAALAAKGTLGDPAVLRGHVERMLADPKAGRFTDNFTGQWLDLRKIDFTQPDKKLYPEFDELLKTSMVKETHLFFEEILKGDRSVREFVHADWSMLNGRLAEHYGVPGVTGEAFRRVPLPPALHRGGVLTQASVLKVTANGTGTSPVIRGVWVNDRILGRPVPPPPKDVPAIEPDIRGAKTIREQLAKHRDQASCAGCHAKIDPPGFALEAFDVIGGWRENYRVVWDYRVKSPFKKSAAKVDGRPVQYAVGPKVDPVGELPDGRAFADIDGFKKLILADPDALARGVAGKLLTYATGQGPAFADRAALDAVVARAKAKDYGLRTLVHEVVQSETFRNK